MAMTPLTGAQVNALYEYSFAARQALNEAGRLAECLAARKTDRDRAQAAVNETQQLLSKAMYACAAENRRLTLFISGYSGPGGPGL